MSEFVAGQWVKCVDDVGASSIIRRGEFYRIIKTQPSGMLLLSGVDEAFLSDRFRPVSWQVGCTYRTMLEGVTATITSVEGHVIRGVVSGHAVGGVWDADGTGRCGGCELGSKAVPHLTPYLADPSPAVETTEPSKPQQIRDDVHQFDTGAVHGTDANGTRFDLISPHILQALAETYAEGAKKYGDDNRLKGIPSKDLMNHALRHINLWQLGDTSEDHLAHAMWNLGAIIHFTKTRPELIVRQYAPQPQ